MLTHSLRPYDGLPHRAFEDEHPTLAVAAKPQGGTGVRRFAVNPERPSGDSGAKPNLSLISVADGISIAKA